MATWHKPEKNIAMHVKLNVKQYLYMKHLYFNGYPIYVTIIREFLELLVVTVTFSKLADFNPGPTE